MAVAVALFKRKKAEDREKPRTQVFPLHLAWRQRLGHIGDTLDRDGATVRDVTITINGDAHTGETLAHVLVWRTTKLHSSWEPVTTRIAHPLQDPLAYSTPLGSWGRGMRAIGALLDQQPFALYSPTIVVTDEGVVVSALVSDPLSWGGKRLKTLEFPMSNVEETADAILVPRTQKVTA